MLSEWKSLLANLVELLFEALFLNVVVRDAFLLKVFMFADARRIRTGPAQP